MYLNVCAAPRSSIKPKDKKHVEKYTDIIKTKTNEKESLKQSG